MQVVTVDKTEHPKYVPHDWKEHYRFSLLHFRDSCFHSSSFADNLRLSPSKERIVVTNSPSFPALHQLFQTRRTFDVIYIDGAHDARTVIEDAVIAWPLLNPDGIRFTYFLFVVCRFRCWLALMIRCDDIRQLP